MVTFWLSINYPAMQLSGDPEGTLAGLQAILFLV